MREAGIAHGVVDVIRDRPALAGQERQRDGALRRLPWLRKHRRHLLRRGLAQPSEQRPVGEVVASRPDISLHRITHCADAQEEQVAAEIMRPGRGRGRRRKQLDLEAQSIAELGDIGIAGETDADLGRGRRTIESGDPYVGQQDTRALLLKFHLLYPPADRCRPHRPVQHRRRNQRGAQLSGKEACGDHRQYGRKPRPSRARPQRQSQRHGRANQQQA
jgi:hypothetical protein